MISLLYSPASVGAKVTGIVGEIINSFGVKNLQPWLPHIGTVLSQNNTVEPVQATLLDIKQAPQTYINRLVHVSHVTLTTNDDTFAEGMTQPVMKDGTEEGKMRIFKQRKDNPELKIALDAGIGFFQSQYCRIMDCGPYSLARLAQKALNRNKEKMVELTERMKNRGYQILAHNTDGIWYTGGVYHGRGEGPNVGEWENDHINCKYRAKSKGIYDK